MPGKPLIPEAVHQLPLRVNTAATVCVCNSSEYCCYCGVEKSSLYMQHQFWYCGVEIIMTATAAAERILT
jgi:hypothetical protein